LNELPPFADAEVARLTPGVGVFIAEFCCRAFRLARFISRQLSAVDDDEAMAGDPFKDAGLDFDDMSVRISWTGSSFSGGHGRKFLDLVIAGVIGCSFMSSNVTSSSMPEMPANLNVI
jgi:hypothetical protein